MAHQPDSTCTGAHFCDAGGSARQAASHPGQAGADAAAATEGTRNRISVHHPEGVAGAVATLIDEARDSAMDKCFAQMRQLLVACQALGLLCMRA